MAGNNNPEGFIPHTLDYPNGFLLWTMDFWLSAMNYRLPAIDYRLPAMSFRLSTMDYGLSTYRYKPRPISEQNNAVAIPTFNDSAPPFRGIVIAFVINFSTSGLKPLPSLPITTNPSLPKLVL